MSRRFQILLASVLNLAVAVPNPFCQAQEISRRATNILTGTAVPPCAQDCLLSVIESGFPAAVCPNPRDLSCLCTRRSTAGFALGEAALSCVYSSCLNPGIREFQVYAICSGIPNALPNTHTAITITATTMTTTERDPIPSETFSETTFLPSSSPGITPSSTLATPTSSSTSTTRLSTGLLSSASTSTQPTRLPSESPQPPSAKDAPPMTSAQVIGAAIGGAVAGALILASIILLLLRSRRKKMMRRHESEFEIGGQMSEPPPQDSQADYRGSRALGSPIGIYNEPVVRRLTLPTNNIRQSATAAPNAAAGSLPYLYPTYRHSGSDDASLSTPNAAKSKSPRRISQLLPEKPNYEMYSSQHPITERLGRRPDSSTTVFEEDEDDRKAIVAANNHWLPTHIGGGYNNSANRNYSQRQQYGHQYGHHYGHQYAAYQNNGRHLQQEQRRQRQQPPTLRLVTPASSNGHHGRTNMTTSPPKVTYQRMDFGPATRPNWLAPSGYSNFYPRTAAGAGAGTQGGPVDPQSSHRRRTNDRTSAGSVTSFESVELNSGARNGNIGSVPKRGNIRLSPVRERSTSPDPNAYPKPLSEPLRHTPMARRSANANIHLQGQEQWQEQSVKTNTTTMGKGINGSNPRSFPYPSPASAANTVPRFPKFHQPLRPPIPPPKPKPQPQPPNQRQQRQYSPHTISEPRNSGTSSNSNSNNSLLSKRRGEAVADRMESELNVTKAGGRRPSHLDSENQSDSAGAVQGVLRTPSPSLASQARQKRQAQQQQRRRGRENTDEDSDGYVEQFDQLSSQGRKLTPTRRGPDLYLNVE